MNYQDFVNKANALGFQDTFCIPANAHPEWSRAARTVNDFNGRPGMLDDPKDRMSEAESLIVLTRAFHPYKEEPGRAAVNAYYTNSHASDAAVKELANWLIGEGFRTEAHISMPLKAIAQTAGAGCYGRNGIIGSHKWGTYMVLQALLTDAVFPENERGRPSEFSECGSCTRCVDLCPTGALRGDGSLDRMKCLRQHHDILPMREDLRPLIGTSMIGCEICQRVCPRNAQIEPQDMPIALRDALDLPALLRGETDALGVWIGTNYARKARVQARACLVAANAGRVDCVEIIESLLTHEMDFVREHAKWALEVLRG